MRKPARLCPISYRMGTIDSVVASATPPPGRSAVARRVVIDPDLCIGSGECNRLVPAGFRLDEALGVSVPLPGAENLPVELLYDAEGGCPTGAISILEEGGS